MTNDCWLYAGTIDVHGYGVVWNQAIKSSEKAYRLMYEAFRDKIPTGLHVDHLCRNRICVNPDHLEAVTLKENILRGEGAAAKNARKMFCARGHKLIFMKTQRGCPTCRSDYWRGYRNKNLEKRRAYEAAWARNNRLKLKKASK